ncbi:MAG: hypothetical protein VX127_14085 [Myxococcota bacterium]|nr:hypothetical protein [Myxococcota bacterium]
MNKYRTWSPIPWHRPDDAHRIVSNPDVEPWRLLWAARSLGPKTAAHAGYDFGAVIAANPAAPDDALFLLHRRGMIGRPDRTRKKTEASRAADDWNIVSRLWSWGYIDDAQHESVCGDPNTPVKVLRDLTHPDRPVDKGSRNPPTEMHRRLAMNPAVPFRGLLELMEWFPLEVSENTGFRLGLLADRSFIVGLHYRRLEALCSCPGIDPRVLRAIGSGGTVRHHTAANPACPPDLLEQFVRGGEMKRVRIAAASNPKLPLAGQWRAARDRYVWMRRAVARCPTLNGDVIEFLCTPQQDPYVLWSLARHPNASVAVLQRIARFANDDAKQLATERLAHPSTPSPQPREPSS